MSFEPNPFLMLRCTRRILTRRDADELAMAALQGGAALATCLASVAVRP